jgi:hypothetical protein
VRSLGVDRDLERHAALLGSVEVRQPPDADAYQRASVADASFGCGEGTTPVCSPPTLKIASVEVAQVERGCGRLSCEAPGRFLNSTRSSAEGSVSPPSARAPSGRNRTRGSEWQTRSQPEVTFHPAPTSARTAATRFRWDRRDISGHAHNAATVSGTRSPAETAFMTHIPTATPRDAPSVGCLGMARAQGLVDLATSASGRNATLKPSTWIVGRQRRKIKHRTRLVVRGRRPDGTLHDQL